LNAAFDAMANSVVITGASSGIGEALALHFAQSGNFLGLTGRDRGRLEAAAARCRARGAEVTTACLDVGDREAMRNWLVCYDSLHPVDLLFANAGITGGVRPDEMLEDGSESYRLFGTNALGVLNTIHPLLPRMVARKRGQIAIMSSLAGLTPLPDAPSYAASKAAVLNYGLSLRTAVHTSGVKVNVICPGHVRTPMTAREVGWKPFEMPVERAVELIVHGLACDKAVIAFPFVMVWLTRIGAVLPESIRRVTEKAFRYKVTGTD
jgi:short-subunit dehydrogenase